MEEVSWDEVENAEIDSQFESLSDIQISLLLVEMLEFYSYLLTFCKTAKLGLMQFYWIIFVDICCENVESIGTRTGVWRFLWSFQSFAYSEYKNSIKLIEKCQHRLTGGKNQGSKTKGRRNAINLWKLHTAPSEWVSVVIWNKTFCGSIFVYFIFALFMFHGC